MKVRFSIEGEIILTKKIDKEDFCVTLTSIFVILLLALAILQFLSALTLPNIARYHIEKAFGTPHTFFYLCGLGIMQKDKSWYVDEQNFYDDTSLNVNITKYKDSKLYLFGRFVNSSDQLIVSLNGTILQKTDIQNDGSLKYFWEYHYLEKSFVVELPYKIGKNELILITGNCQERLFINIY
jgi:hypothetical protein